MPNTLAHIGVQGVLSRGLDRRADLKWILLGCVLPDLAWILKRILTAAPLALDAYDLRLYSIVQGSLAFCLLLALAFAIVSKSPVKIFGLLAVNAVFHLLLDACQTKWGSGVHLFAPFSWEQLNLGLFWPESWLTLAMTLGGVVFLVVVMRGSPGREVGVAGVSQARIGISIALVVAWMALPLLLVGGPESTDSHSVRTLRQGSERTGRIAAFDRTSYYPQDSGYVLETMTREQLRIGSGAIKFSGRISARARFRDPGTVDLLETHKHLPMLRDMGSYIGLALVLVVWLRWGLAEARRPPRMQSSGGRARSS